MSDTTRTTATDRRSDDQRIAVRRTRSPDGRPSSSIHHAVFDRLETVQDPDLGDDIVSLGLVDGLHVGREHIVLGLGLYVPFSPDERQILDGVRDALAPFGRDVVTFSTKHATASPGGLVLPGVRTVVPFVHPTAFGETNDVAFHVAAALERRGARVGVLGFTHRDSTVYTVPQIGCPHPECDRPTSSTNSALSHSTDRGDHATCPETIQSSSPPVVEGPSGNGLPKRTVEQLLAAADWGELDYLLLDVPGGDTEFFEAIVELLSLDAAVFTYSRSQNGNVVDRWVERLGRWGVEVIGVVDENRVLDRDFTEVRGELDGETCTTRESRSGPEAFDHLAVEVIDALGSMRRRTHGQRSRDGR